MKYTRHFEEFSMNKKFQKMLLFQQFFHQLPVEVIRNSFYACGISVATDGSQDEKTMCFKPDSSCSTGRKMLKAQLQLLECQEDNPSGGWWDFFLGGKLSNIRRGQN